MINGRFDGKKDTRVYVVINSFQFSTQILEN
jgi:hypothetical protein